MAGHDDPRRPAPHLATLPTPLERGPDLPGGAALWCKRDDLTGLGLGGNKARKLEHLCAAALAEGADALVTVGGAQSNHCRMTAAAGARLGLPVVTVFGGDRPTTLAGNPLLAELFGAELRFAGSHDWADLTACARAARDELRAAGRRPALVPIGGSTAVGTAGFALAYLELAEQLLAADVDAAAVVHTTSSGGTHAGLLAGRVLAGRAGLPTPPVLAVAASPGPGDDPTAVVELADAALAHLGEAPGVDIADVEVDTSRLGGGYEVPTDAADAAIVWAARHAGWVLDRTYTGKGVAGVLGGATEGRWGLGEAVVFWHTGGSPAVFTTDGVPPTART